jgi:Generalcontrol nonderepressible 1 (Gcn1) N-terminal
MILPSSSTQFGLVFLHLAIESPFLQVRQAVLATIEMATLGFPKLTSSIVREALTSFLSRDPLPSTTKGTSGPGEEPVTTWDKQGRLFALLLRTVSFGDNVERSEKEDILVKFLILGHHSFTSKLIIMF